MSEIDGQSTSGTTLADAVFDAMGDLKPCEYCEEKVGPKERVKRTIMSPSKPVIYLCHPCHLNSPPSPPPARIIRG